jgi:uncharacterized protein YkwD
LPTPHVQVSASVRRCAALVALVAGAIAMLLLPATAEAARQDESGARTDRALSADLLAEVNAVREERGRRPLLSVASLRRAARSHAASMGERGYFSHVRAGDERGLAQAYSGEVAETLFWTGGSIGAREVIDRWLASAPHRKILLGKQFAEIGILAVRVQQAPGVYRGATVTIVVADYGIPQRLLARP